MKKMMMSSLVAMSFGAGMMAYLLYDKDTKKKTKKMVNSAMDMASNKMNNMMK